MKDETIEAGAFMSPLAFWAAMFIVLLVGVIYVHLTRRNNDG